MSEVTDLGVKHDGTEDLGVMHGDPEVVQGPLMILVCTVREIEPSNIHPRPKKLLQHWHGSRSRTQSANNLSLGDASIIRKLLQYTFNINVCHFADNNSSLSASKISGPVNTES